MIINCSYFNIVENEAKDDFEFASSSCEVVDFYASTTIYQYGTQASTTQGFTYGEIMISWFLFLGLILGIINLLILKTSGLKIKFKMKNEL